MFPSGIWLQQLNWGSRQSRGGKQEGTNRWGGDLIEKDGNEINIVISDWVFDDAYFVSTFSCYRSGLFTEKLPLVLNEQPPSRGPAEPRTNSGNNFPGSKIPVKVDREVCLTFFFVMNGYFRFWGERGAWEWQDLDEERAFASSELEIRSCSLGNHQVISAKLTCVWLSVEPDNIAVLKAL